MSSATDTTEDIDVARLVRQIPTQYPFVMIDRVLEHDPSGRLLAVKNVTGSEDFFEGHFPGQPVMPGVLLMEGLAQAAGIWLLHQALDPSRLEVHVVGIDNAKFRRPVVPGDQLELEIQVLQRRQKMCRVKGEIRVGDQRVAEARLLLQLMGVPAPLVDPLARVAPGAKLGPGVKVGPFAVIGPDVVIGADSIIEPHCVIDGDTVLGEGNHVFPFSSIGLAPQDLKFRGEPTKLRIGDRNIFRESVTIHRGTVGGGGLTTIGSDNLFMAYTHVAHDCHVGSHTVFANGGTLAGHVEVADHATIGAYSAIHQFCRVGVHAFLGGYTVATKDVLPYSKTVGSRPARIYGPNTIGLVRRGFPPATIEAIKHAYRVLLQSRLNTSQAIARLEEEASPIPEVQGLVAFVRDSRRGVVLKRHRRGVPTDE
jgi:UDP-N-acetylglucosamine acyltransferase